MHKGLLSLLGLFFSTMAFAQIGGTLDPTFGNAGKVIKSINTGSDKARGVVLLDDGSFVVAGTTVSSVTGSDFYLAKFTDNGSMFATFGVNGVVKTDIQLGSEDVAMAIAYDENTGKFVVAGYSSNGTKQSAVLVRYLASGARDSTFGTNGIVLTNLQGNNNADIFRKVKVHYLTGNIVAVGNTVPSTSTALTAVVRYLPNGTLDSTFNTNGVSIATPLPGAVELLKDVYVAPSGKITATGFISNSSNGWYDGLAVRYNTNGTLDNTFGSGGASRQSYMTYNNAMYLDPNTGKIYVAGSVVAYFGWSSYNERITIKRINANGTDDSWAYAGGNPFHYLADGGNAYCFANAMVPDPNGQFFIAGTAYDDNNKGALLMKMQATGQADYTFADPTSGQVLETFGNTNTETYDIVLQPDDKVVVVGYTGNDMFIARYFGTTVPDLNGFNLISPANNATELVCNEVELDWSDAPGAVGYQVYVDSTLAFAQPDSSLVGSSYIYDYMLSLESATDYYWKVRAYNNSAVGAWAGPWKFTTTLDQINLITPPNNAYNVATFNTFFDWTDMKAGTVNVLQQSFDYQLGTDPSFSGAFIGNTGSTTSNFTSTTSLAQNTTYYWRVRTNRGVYKKGPWSPTFKFNTGSPPTALEAVAEDAVQLYPNPTEQVLHIAATQTPEAVTLFDVQGKAIFYQASLPSRAIDVAHVAPGFYWAVFTIGGSEYRRSWIKQ